MNRREKRDARQAARRLVKTPLDQRSRAAAVQISEARLVADACGVNLLTSHLGSEYTERISTKKAPGKSRLVAKFTKPSPGMLAEFQRELAKRESESGHGVQVDGA